MVRLREVRFDMLRLGEVRLGRLSVGFGGEVWLYGSIVYLSLQGRLLLLDSMILICKTAITLSLKSVRCEVLSRASGIPFESPSLVRIPSGNSSYFRSQQLFNKADTVRTNHVTFFCNNFPRIRDLLFNSS